MLAFDPPISAREFMTDEKLPLAVVFPAVMEMIAGRKDAVVFGALAVNAYVETERMTEDVDILSTDAAGLAERVRSELHRRFHIAARIREMKGGLGFRVYQVREPKNRHLVDVRQVSRLPGSTVSQGVQFVEPVELLAMKVMSYDSRKTQPKGGTDLADIRRLLQAFPQLKKPRAEVAQRLVAGGASERVMETWRAFARDRIEDDSDDY